LLTELSQALAEHGLTLRGGFHPASDAEELQGVATLLLVGNAGAAMWSVFAPHIDGAPNPLDRWTKRAIDPIAAKFGATALYPFDKPHPPFQQWALCAEDVYASPLGILIHPVYGLWHAYRAALLFTERIELPLRSAVENPCSTCMEKPCLSACPVGAFTGSAYDVAACADCLDLGCHARNACPVGPEWRYPDAQVRFHMAAFARSVRADQVGPG
jgi:ferredoxin-like protein FixX